MSKKVGVLKHHYDQIIEFYAGITDREQAEEAVRNGMFPETRGLWAPDGKLAYPNMNEDAMAKSYADMIVAVNTGNAEVLPEWSAQGFKNMDGACGPCGNVVPSAAKKDGKMCDLWIRAAALRSRNRNECR